MTKNSALKVAVIGGGNIAQQHLPVLKDLPEADVVALADANPKVLQESTDRFAIPNRWSSHMELLEEDRPDAVFVLVSVLSVADVAADFIEAWIPTFFEKPLGLYTSQTRRLAALVDQNDALAMVGVNRRFYSTLLQGREKLLESGSIRSIDLEAHEDINRLQGNTNFQRKSCDAGVRRTAFTPWTCSGFLVGISLRLRWRIIRSKDPCRTVVQR